MFIIRIRNVLFLISIFVIFVGILFPWVSVKNPFTGDIEVTYGIVSSNGILLSVFVLIVLGLFFWKPKVSYITAIVLFTLFFSMQVYFLVSSEKALQRDVESLGISRNATIFDNIGIGLWIVLIGCIVTVTISVINIVYGIVEKRNIGGKTDTVSTDPGNGSFDQGVSNEYRNWVINNLNEGYTADQLKESLLNGGKDPSIVDKVLKNEYHNKD